MNAYLATVTYTDGSKSIDFRIDTTDAKTAFAEAIDTVGFRDNVASVTIRKLVDKVENVRLPNFSEAFGFAPDLRPLKK